MVEQEWTRKTLSDLIKHRYKLNTEQITMSTSIFFKNEIMKLQYMKECYIMPINDIHSPQVREQNRC